MLDKDDFSSEEIGTVEFKIKDLLDGEKREGEYAIRKKTHVRDRGKLKLMVKFIPILENEKMLGLKKHQFQCPILFFKNQLLIKTHISYTERYAILFNNP